MFFINRYVKENARNPTNVSRSLVEAVANIQSVVKRQFNEQYLAVLDKGCYQLAEGFKHLGVEEHNYYQMSDSQKKKTRKQFFEATMSNPKKPRNVDVTNDKEEELSFGPEKTGLQKDSF